MYPKDLCPLPGEVSNLQQISLIRCLDIVVFFTEFSQQCQNSTQDESRVTERREVNEDCSQRPQERPCSRPITRRGETCVYLDGFITDIRKQFYFTEGRGWHERVSSKRGFHYPGNGYTKVSGLALPKCSFLFQTVWVKVCPSRPGERNATHRLGCLCHTDTLARACMFLHIRVS